MTATIERPPTRPQLPRAQREPRARDTARIKRRAILALGLVALVFLLMLVHEKVVTPMIHDTRQEHLAASFSTPKPALIAGDAMGVLQIPRLDLNEVVVEDVTVDHLRGGPAHRIDSGLPGDPGVMVIHGHRTLYGGPFRHIDQLLPNDEIVVQARTGPIVKYVVQRVETDVDVATLALENTDLISYLILVTSEPGRTAAGEMAVVARALPLSDVAPVVPDLSAGVDSAPPLGVDTLLAIMSVAAAAAAWAYLRRRTSTPVIVLVMTPLVGYAWFVVALLVDGVGPLTR